MFFMPGPARTIMIVRTIFTTQTTLQVKHRVSHQTKCNTIKRSTPVVQYSVTQQCTAKTCPALRLVQYQCENIRVVEEWKPCRSRSDVTSAPEISTEHVFRMTITATHRDVSKIIEHAVCHAVE